MQEPEFHDAVIRALARLEASETANLQTLARIEKIVFTGNGQPSLIVQIATLNSQMAERQKEGAALASTVTPDKTQVRKETVVTSAMITTIIIGVVAAVDRLLPVITGH